MPGGSLKIGIVGGSIAGCTAAIELLRAGHNVVVYERFTGRLKGRGAGIGTPVSVLHQLIDRDLIDLNIPYLHVEEMRHYGKVSGGPPTGRLAWRASQQMEFLNWSDLWRNLRSRVADTCYRDGLTVLSALSIEEGRSTLMLEGGQVEEYDLVIFADGYRSLGRRLILPGTQVSYRGYVLWRGVLAESALSDSEPLEGALSRVGFTSGHAVFNFVPADDGSVHLGQRQVNWALYEPIAPSELPGFLVDRDGYQRPGSLPPNKVRTEEVVRIKRFARHALPAYFSDVIAATEVVMAQPIYTTVTPSYFRGRICLAGDAGSFVQPFTTSGVFKAVSNAVGLADALSGSQSIDKALDEWSRAETLNASYMVALGAQLENALIWNIPDFGSMTEPDMRTWWESAARLPEDLYPPAGFETDE